MGETRNPNGSYWPWFIGVLVVAAACVLTWIVISDGQRMVPRDSPTYLSSAEHLAAGRPFQTSFGDRGKSVDFDSSVFPVIDFPPGYPFVLSLGVRAGLSSFDAATLVTVLSVGAVAGLFFAYARRRLGSVWASALVGLLAGTLTMRMTYAPLSEPVFGLLVAASLMAASIFIRSRHLLWFWLAAVAVVASVSVRTAGLAVVVVIAAAGWIGLKGSVYRVSATGGLLLANLWLFFATTGAGSRTMGWHPPDLTSIKVGTDAIVSLLVPPIATPTVRLAIFATLIVIAGYWMARGRDRSARIGIGWLDPSLLGFWAAVTQVGMLLATRAVFDAQTDPSFRLLYPVAIALLVSIVDLASDARVRAKLVRAGDTLAAVGLVALMAAGAWVIAGAADLRADDGLLFAEPDFVDSPALSLVREELVGTIPLYSNVPDGLWVADIDGARAIPVDYDPLSLEPNPNIEDEMNRLQEEIDGGAAVVYYRKRPFGYLVDEDALLSVAPCVVTDDGDTIVLTSSRGPACP